MKVLIACEFSGIVRDAFAAKGHDAWSCDLLPTERPGQHFQEDIFHVLHSSRYQNWDLIIAHPPCTYLCNSGVQWLKKDAGRTDKMRKAAIFFRSLLYANCEKVCIENPIPHKYALEIIGRKYDQIVQPWQFGHMEKKATCFWLKGLSTLTATNDVRHEMLKLPKNQQQRLHYLPPSAERAKLRSKTYEGIALAMADQWGAIEELKNAV